MFQPDEGTVIRHSPRHLPSENGQQHTRVVQHQTRPHRLAGEGEEEEEEEKEDVHGVEEGDLAESAHEEGHQGDGEGAFERFVKDGADLEMERDDDR